MKSFITLSITCAVLLGVMAACGPSEEELRQQEQARQDSLARVEQQRQEQERQARMEQARQDSLEAVRREEEERKNIQFDDNGRFAVQVEAWRSETKAEAQVGKWQGRGYENAYVVKHGNEDTGDVWFRVRLGRFTNRQMAEKFQALLQEDYNARSWISIVNQ